jgi:23S rRNA (adenine2503-C2)-methyltransferase
MGLLKDLSAAQIVAQVWHARHTLGLPVRNLVFMGMGEPLDNLDAVLQAIAVLTDPSGLSIAKSRITISTSGRVDGILRLAEELDPAVNLAVSVNAPNDRVRTKLMPVNRRYSMAMLKEAMERYCVHPRREILVEYVLLKGINDSLSDADQLADYLKGLRAKVNLIPYNPQSNMRYQPPSASQADLFAAQLRQRGLYTLMRSTKGQQIMAACGQLGNVQARFTNRNPPGNVAKKTGEGS